MAVEKLDLSENRPKRSDRKCIGDRRRSFIGHPDATHFRRKFCERVFQQLQAITLRTGLRECNPFAIRSLVLHCFSWTSVPSVALHVVECTFSRGFECYLRRSIFKRLPVSAIRAFGRFVGNMSRLTCEMAMLRQRWKWAAIKGCSWLLSLRPNTLRPQQPPSEGI